MLKRLSGSLVISLVLLTCINEDNKTYAYDSVYNNIETIELGINNNNVQDLQKSSKLEEVTLSKNTKKIKANDDSDSGNIEADEKLNNTIEYESEIENNDEVDLVVAEVDLSNEELNSDVNIVQNGLINISNPDENYTGQALDISNERDLLERIVMGEAGGEGFEGQALVAQCIRDTMLYKNIDSVQGVISRLKYSGSLNKTPTEEVKRAVSYIFDEGNNAVQHKLIYFYAPKVVYSRFHENQEFIIEHGGHRFFDERS